MKKRKTPVLLLSMLLVLIGGVVVFSMTQGGPQKPVDPEKLTDTHGAPSAEAVASDVVKNTGTPTKKMPDAMALDGGPQGPSIALSNKNYYRKPQPNASGTTNPQWYVH